MLLHAVNLNNLSLCFSPSLSPSAVWMYGFTDSPRKEASGSLVCLCQHAIEACFPTAPPHSVCEGQIYFFQSFLSLPSFKSISTFQLCLLACAVILHSIHPPSKPMQSCHQSLLHQSQAPTLALDPREVLHQIFFYIWLQCDSKCDCKTTACEITDV